MKAGELIKQLVGKEDFEIDLSFLESPPEAQGFTIRRNLQIKGVIDVSYSNKRIKINIE